MADAERLDLVFLAGMSAVAVPDDVSGPLTGLAGVRASIGLVSEPGTGTTFHVRIPLTLAIIPAVTIECAGDRYATPQVSLVELVSQGTGSGARAIENLCGAPVYRLRGRLLPLVSLREALGRGTPAHTEADVTIAVLQADGQQFGLVVDRVLGTEEIVVNR
jgi:two-component system, chemotaxis family, sensor kinase CheA